MNGEALRLDAQNPWPGLASYDEGAAHYFHGRDADGAELFRLIKRSHFVTLFGKSGLGKSSLLMAGTFPRLREDNFLPIYLRLDYTAARQPVLDQALARVLEAVDSFARDKGAEVSAPAPDQGLWAWLQREDVPIWTRDNFPVTPVLVFDQFEEAFSGQAPPEEVRKVLAGLADLIGNRIPAALSEQRGATQGLNLGAQQYRTVLSFRSDFLAEVDTWARQASLPRRETMHLNAMSRDRAIRAIEKAGEKVVAKGVPQQIVDFLLKQEGAGATAGRSKEVEPVLLSLFCYQLNRKRLEQQLAQIDEALVASAGQRILRDFYDGALQGMGPHVARFIETNLIVGRFRNPCPLEHLLGPEGITAGELDQLIAKRLLRKDTQGDVVRVELIHDRIVGVVSEARDTRAAQARQQAEIERLRQEREAAERKAAEDLERQREQAEREAQAERLHMEEERSKQAERLRAAEEALRIKTQRKNKQLVTSLAFAVVGLCGILILGVKTFQQNGELNRKTDELKETVDNQVNKLNEAQSRLDGLQKQFNLATAELNAFKEKATEAVRIAAEDAKQAASRAATEAEAAKASSRNASLTLNDWRLQSSGCSNGPLTATGTAVFWADQASDGRSLNIYQTVKAGGRTSTGKPFDVQSAPKLTTVTVQPRADSTYDVELIARWSSDAAGFRSFTSRSTQRLVLNNKLSVTRAYLTGFRTDCGG